MHILLPHAETDFWLVLYIQTVISLTVGIMFGWRSSQFVDLKQKEFDVGTAAGKFHPFLFTVANVSLILQVASRFEMKPVVARCGQSVARTANTLDRERLFQVTFA